MAGWIVVVVLVLVFLVAGGVAAYVLLSGAGSDGAESGEDQTTAVPAGDGPEAYAALGDGLADQLSDCSSVDPPDGATEQLDCVLSDPDDVEDATAVLVTYEDADALAAARRAVAHHDVGTRYQAYAEGLFWDFQDVADGVVEMWWDVTDEMQSIHIVGGFEADRSARRSFDPVDPLAALVDVFQGSAAPIDYPEAISDPDLAELAAQFSRPGSLDLSSCAVRGQHLDPGEIEENRCAADDDSLVVYLVKSATVADHDDARERVSADATENGGTNDTWTFEAESGTAVGDRSSYVQDGAAYVYWEASECLCYGFAVRPDGNLTALLAWWSGA